MSFQTMPTLPATADIAQTARNVRSVPCATKVQCIKGVLLDHVVGEGSSVGRTARVKLLGSFPIYNQLKLALTRIIGIVLSRCISETGAHDG
jgi:hypothetical protein